MSRRATHDPWCGCSWCVDEEPACAEHGIVECGWCKGVRVAFVDPAPASAVPVKLARLENKGRAIVATRRLEPGHEVLLERPFAFVMRTAHAEAICGRCAAPIAAWRGGASFAARTARRRRAGRRRRTLRWRRSWLRSPRSASATWICCASFCGCCARRRCAQRW